VWQRQLFRPAAGRISPTAAVRLREDIGRNATPNRYRSLRAFSPSRRNAAILRAASRCGWAAEYVLPACQSARREKRKERAQKRRVMARR